MYEVVLSPTHTLIDVPLGSYINNSVAVKTWLETHTVSQVYAYVTQISEPGPPSVDVFLDELAVFLVEAGALVQSDIVGRHPDLLEEMDQEGHNNSSDEDDEVGGWLRVWFADKDEAAHFKLVAPWQ